MISANPRVTASHLLLRVIYFGESLSDLLSGSLMEPLNESDKAFVKDICFGSLRYYEAINFILNKLLVKPLKRKDKDIECLIRIGIYQITYQRTPDHAAVNETVNATKKLKKKWSRGLVNGVLRQYLRNKEELLGQSEAIPLMPNWLMQRIKASWPDRWEDVIKQSNQKPPMSLRVNLAQQTRETYVAKLKQQGITAHADTFSGSGVILDKPCPVDKLPNFFQGAVSVQDIAAQFAAPLLDGKQGMAVLDACAAPGGKTGHLLELNNSIKLLAVDNQPERLQRIHENLQRLGFDKDASSINIKLADIANLESWTNDIPFDRILLDSPCSATGVIRRHPDIKLLRQKDDIKSLQEQQRRILEAVWTRLSVGGNLLYATCSILPEENEQQIEWFLKRHSDAESCTINADWGIPLKFGRQILPGISDMDGFYYALITKKP